MINLVGQLPRDQYENDVDLSTMELSYNKNGYYPYFQLPRNYLQKNSVIIVPSYYYSDQMFLNSTF